MSEAGVNLFDYVNSKEVFVQSVYMSKCLIDTSVKFLTIRPPFSLNWGELSAI